jgi:hypothetical protein
MKDSGSRQHREGSREGPSDPTEADAELRQVIAGCLHDLESGADVHYRPEELGRRISLLLAIEGRQRSA